MKKNVFFAAAFMLMAGGAFAQAGRPTTEHNRNVTPIAQSPLNNTNANSAKIEQVLNTNAGLQHNATIDQLGGTGNIGDIYQGPASGGVATIYQEGSSNKGLISTVNSGRHDIVQVGAGNTAQGTGEGNLERGLQRQTGNNNTALIYMAGGAGNIVPGSGGSVAEQIQTGDNNYASVGSTHIAGGANQQDNSPKTYQTQIGNGNTSNISRNAHDQATTIQDGHLNEVDVIQRGERLIGGSEAYVAQTGDGNRASVNQTSDGIYTEGNYARVIQTGDLNTVNARQSDSDNSLTADQIGNGNTIGIHQTGGASATIWQQGDGNVVKGLGLSTEAQSLNGSSLNVTQTGDGHIANIYQNNGVAEVIQSGGALPGMNVATINQQ